MNKIIKLSLLGTLIFANNIKSTISVLEFVSDPKNREVKQSGLPGLSGQVSLNVSNWLVSKQNYIPALKHLWNEKNKDLRLKWLHEKANEGHAIMMLELSYLFYYLNKFEESCYWFCLGTRKAIEDAYCYTDESIIQQTIEKIRSIYLFNNSLRVILPMQKHMDMAKKAHNDLKTWNKKPSPEWLMPSNELLPQSEWDNARKKSMEYDKNILYNERELLVNAIADALKYLANPKNTTESKKRT